MFQICRGVGRQVVCDTNIFGRCSKHGAHRHCMFVLLLEAVPRTRKEVATPSSFLGQAIVGLEVSATFPEGRERLVVVVAWVVAAVDPCLE